MNAPNTSGWKPGDARSAATAASVATATGNRGLMLEEALIFEIGGTDTAASICPSRRPARPARRPRSASHRPARPVGTGDGAPLHPPVSRQNYAIDCGLFPLGSCTMKHNPRLNEKVARLPGFADIHPLQPESTCRARWS